MGSRLNAWHAEVYRHLPGDVEAVAFNTSQPRYPADGVPIPVESLAWENEVGSWPRRKLLNLRYRLTHALTGFELDLAPAAERFAGFNLIHTWELFTPWTRLALDAGRRHRIPVVVTVWDNLPFNHSHDARHEGTRGRALAEAMSFLAVSRRSAEALRLEGVDAGRIALLPPSVDLERFNPAGRNARDLLGLTREDEVVLAVARLAPEKGLRFFLDAVALIAKVRPRLKLVLVGSGSEEASLRERSARLGIGSRIVFAGDRPYEEMPAFYRMAEVFVLASVPVPGWQEQWGQSLLEAMACAVPVVATLTGAVPEVVADAGILVQPGDFLALAEALTALLDDPVGRAAFAKSGRARVEREYDARVRASELAALYRRFAAGRA